MPDAELMDQAKAMAERLAAQPHQAMQETKRALNLHLQEVILRAAPFALSAESESFTTRRHQEHDRPLHEQAVAAPAPKFEDVVTV